ALRPAVPTASIVLAGTLLDNDVLRWAGAPVGIATGVFLAWWLGLITYRRLEARGPELLTLMRTGKPSDATTVKARPDIVAMMPRWKRLLFTTLCPVVGSIALVPQGLVPLVIQLSGGHERIWF